MSACLWSSSKMITNMCSCPLFFVSNLFEEKRGGGYYSASPSSEVPFPLDSRYLVCVAPPTVLHESYLNFVGFFFMKCRGLWSVSFFYLFFRIANLFIHFSVEYYLVCASPAVFRGQQRHQVIWTLLSFS